MEALAFWWFDFSIRIVESLWKFLLLRKWLASSCPLGDATLSRHKGINIEELALQTKVCTLLKICLCVSIYFSFTDEVPVVKLTVKISEFLHLCHLRQNYYFQWWAKHLIIYIQYLLSPYIFKRFKVYSPLPSIHTTLFPALAAQVAESPSGALWRGKWQGNQIVAKILALRELTPRIIRDFNDEFPKLRLD